MQSSGVRLPDTLWNSEEPGSKSLSKCTVQNEILEDTLTIFSFGILCRSDSESAGNETDHELRLYPSCGVFLLVRYICSPILHKYPLDMKYAPWKKGAYMWWGNPRNPG